MVHMESRISSLQFTFKTYRIENYACYGNDQEPAVFYEPDDPGMRDELLFITVFVKEHDQYDCLNRACYK